MLWSLLKVLLFVAAIAALTWGASLLLETGGGIRLAAGGYEMTLGPLQAVIGLLILMLGIWLLMRLIGLIVATLRFFNGDETAISRYFDRDRQRKGYQALSDGFLALASGEARLALLRCAAQVAPTSEFHVISDCSHWVPCDRPQVGGSDEEADCRVLRCSDSVWEVFWSRVL